MKISREFKIGIVVIAAIAILVWGISFLKGINLFSPKYELYAVYPRIENLITANPLLVNGFKIGQVSEIKLINHHGKQQVLVKFNLTEDIQIPKGTIARAVSSDLLGSKAVELIFSESQQFVATGDTLLAETEQSLKESFNRQIAPIQAKAEKLIGGMDSVMSVINAILNAKTRKNIDESFEGVKRAILSLEQTAYKMDDLIGSEKTKISSVMSNLNQITTNLSKNGQKIDNILANVSNISDSLAKAQIKDAIANADKSMKELSILLNKINEGQGTLGKLAKNDSLYNNLNKSTADLDKLLKDLRINPERYIHFSVFGRKYPKPKD
ncbi:MAG: MlaD family protein [Bacteroidota bacterium]|jgi:phospholipid/cholesterol/gamma-HCH transport system substrate-binding protein|nr:MCE family protein [Bacteroidota bacterium]MCA6443757.1 MCE family protein [Bacteroidota bacterium]